MPARERVPYFQSKKRVARLSLVALGLVACVALALALFPNLRTTMAELQPAPRPAPIDGDRAYGYLKTICAIGPRPAGSEANTRQRDMVADHFKKHGAQVREQPFQARDPLSGNAVSMVNLIGSWFPDRTERVLISAHYDTRPYHDRDPDPKRAPFIGANDGASGVALLMEMAHHMNDLPTPWGVDLVLLDGEELVYGTNAAIDDYFLGSKHFAKTYKSERRSPKNRSHYVAGFVLDMVGDRDLKIDQEQYSLELADRLVREVWSVAQRLGATSFKHQRGTAVYDDHLPLNDGGIPTIDLIDFDYPQWHTSQDLPEFCSGKSLAEVGRVLTGWLTMPKSRTRKK
ncbi:MAG TPA: M28 family peptidase [Isosphaeraceae bacterium]|nr:M28 family peptidase [Isosphaeraceae bacterium]